MSATVKKWLQAGAVIIVAAGAFIFTAYLLFRPRQDPNQITVPEITVPERGKVTFELAELEEEAEVFLDNKTVAPAILRNPVEMDLGEHELRLNGPINKGVVRFTVKSGDSSVKVPVVEFGRVAIALVPPGVGARVILKGPSGEMKELGPTEIGKPLPLQVGQHQLTVSGEYTKHHETSFAVHRGVSTTMSVPLSHEGTVGIKFTPTALEGSDKIRLTGAVGRSTDYLASHLAAPVRLPTGAYELEFATPYADGRTSLRGPPGT